MNKRLDIEGFKRWFNRSLYRVLGEIHLALVTDAGLIIFIFGPFLFGRLFIPQRLISWLLLIVYMMCDRIRLRFPRGATISMGFPITFLTLLFDSPFAALFTTVVGSLASEVFGSRFLSRQRLLWGPSLRRAFFYAGHHATAGLGALIAYQLVGAYVPAWPELEGLHIPALLAYVFVYSPVSMLLVWPHDRRVWLFLAPDEEPFARVDWMTLLLVPLPASVYYLYNLNLGQTAKVLIVVGFLPPLFIMLFLLARNITKMAAEEERMKLREEIERRLGSPASMAEMADRLLRTMEELVSYRWGAVYSSQNDELRLLGERDPKKGIRIYQPQPGAEGGESPFPSTGAPVLWPSSIQRGEGPLGEMAADEQAPRFFVDGLFKEGPADLSLPPQTALAVFPIRLAPGEGEAAKEPPALLGLIALARPRRRFTTWDWEKGRTLSDKTGRLLRTVQRLEQALQELYVKVEEYAQDPEKVRWAMWELMQRNVDVSQILAVIARRAFEGNLKAVLEDMVENRRRSKTALTDEELTEIYELVRAGRPGMPPLTPDISERLKLVTSSLSLAFSFRYQFPDMDRGPAFREFYQLLLDMLEADTPHRIAGLDSKVVSFPKTMGKQSQVAPDMRALPPEVLEEVKAVREIIQTLKEYTQLPDSTEQRQKLDQALGLLATREVSVRRRLRDPERFVFLQTLSGWRRVITTALERLTQGPAKLSVRLRSQQALSLDRTTVGLVVQNEGPGLASSIVVRLEPGEGYEVIEGVQDLGTLLPGRAAEPEFSIRPRGGEPLRLEFLVTYNDPEQRGKQDRYGYPLYLQEPPSCFQYIPNPYTPGIPIRPGNPTFVGREDIFEFIRRKADAMAQKMILVLVGERRSGKTSVLTQLPVRLEGLRYIPVFIDAQSLGIDMGMGNFLLSLATSIVEGLGRAGIAVPGMTPADVVENPRYVFEQRFLPEVRARIGDRLLLLCLDEFEELGRRVQRGGLPEEVFPYLRHLIQHEEKLAFIFAGTHEIEELVGDYWSVLFNIAIYKKVGFLKREEAIRLIREPVQPSGMVYDDLAIEEILRLTGGHPYFTQLICYQLVERCNETCCSYITVQDVRDGVDELLENGKAHLTFLWGTSDPEARVALAALAELRDQMDRVTAAAIADRLGDFEVDWSPAQISQILEKPIARDIVQATGDPVAYDFTAQLYVHWLRKYKPLSKVVEEVEGEPATE